MALEPHDCGAEEQRLGHQLKLRSPRTNEAKTRADWLKRQAPDFRSVSPRFGAAAFSIPIFLVHGAVFVVYVAVSLLAWRVLRWDLRTAALALIASVPPFTTVWFERWAARTGRLPLGETVARTAG